MWPTALRFIFFALLLNLATFAPARANYDHAQDVQRAGLQQSDEERMSHIGKCYRAELGQHRRTPPLRFSDEPDSMKNTWSIYQTMEFTVLDYIRPTDFKILFAWGKVAYINSNEFEWGYHSAEPDRAIFDCAKPKPVVKKKVPPKKKIKKRKCRPCCCCCNPCCCHKHPKPKPQHQQKPKDCGC